MIKQISQRKLDGLRREWQKLLRLQDWKIKVSLVIKADVEPDTLGNCQHLAEARQANLKLVKPELLDLNDEREQDIENTLVHELLHCHFAPFQAKDETTMVLQEQAIEAITEALVMLKRGESVNKRRKG